MKTIQILHNPTVIPELIARYEAVLKSDRITYFYGQVDDYKRSIEIKILELRQILSKHKKQTAL